jgi:hypothetical protein
MTQSSLTKNMVFDILTHERFPVRFEDFCAALFTDIDGEAYVTTSRTWDHGRDARATSSRREGQPPFMCCGIEDDDVVGKAASDTARICETVAPLRITYCFTDPAFSEHKVIQIEDKVRSIASSLKVVRSYGADQLAQLVIQYPQAFEYHYRAEVSEMRAALATSSVASDQVELTGLRLALTTQLTEDAQVRRRDLIRNLVLTSLAQGATARIDEIATRVSEQLHLPRAVNPGWLQSAINDLLHDGRITATEKSDYTIAPAGIDEIKSRTAAGSKVVVDGQVLILDSIRTLTGHSLNAHEWHIVWSVLQKNITGMFLAHGVTILESIDSITSGKSSISEHAPLRDHIHSIVEAISSIPGKGARIQEIAQAVSDMFQEKKSAAFGWLTGLCEVYVHLCTLGLEPTAQNQMLSHLQEIELLIDTDVALSLLSTGDENHAAVETILHSWHKVGGGLRVCQPVLEEAAHHAWISEVDYYMTWRLFPKLTAAAAQHNIENAFVRGYWNDVRNANGLFSLRNWNQYIAAFRGQTHLDYAKIEELLDDQGIELLPDSPADSEVADRIAVFLFDLRKGRVGTSMSAIDDLREKSERDGRLVAVLLRRRKELTSAKRTAFVVSTSMFLRQVTAIQPELKQSVPVLSIAAIAWLLSLAPGAHMNSSSLRDVLFDVDFPRHISPVERVSLRILQASEEYQFHFSRRSTLKRAIREKLLTIATQEDVSESDVTARFLSRDEGADVLKANVIVSAIDSMARSKSEKDVAALHQRIQDLEKLLARERESHKG